MKKTSMRKIDLELQNSIFSHDRCYCGALVMPMPMQFGGHLGDRGYRAADADSRVCFHVPDRPYRHRLYDRTDILACGRTGGLGVAAGADGNRPRLHLSSESVIELAARARHRSHRHRFRRSGTIENKGSGGRPPSCGGSPIGLRRGLPGNLVHVEDLGVAGCSRASRTLIEGDADLTLEEVKESLRVEKWLVRRIP